MSVFSALFDSKVQNFEQAFGVKDITTSGMKAAIRDWYDLYYRDKPDDREDPCQRLPFTVVNKLTKTVFSEYEAKSENEFAERVLMGLERRRKQAMQHALIGGECFLKPLLMADGRVEFSTIQRRNYLVLGRNETDAITDIGTQESTEVGGFYYTLLERRTIDPGGYLTIESRLYRSDTRDMIGIEVPLNTWTNTSGWSASTRFLCRYGPWALYQLRVPWRTAWTVQRTACRYMRRRQVCSTSSTLTKSRSMVSSNEGKVG